MSTVVASSVVAVALPGDDQLAAALRLLRMENPTLGISKLHLLLVRSVHPEWAGFVSEKRAKRILIAEGLNLVPPAPKNGVVSTANHTSGKTKNSVKGKGERNGEDIHPTSRIIDNLDVTRWAKNVRVEDFGPLKGKGLVATAPIKEGEDVWKEDPFVLAPEWDIYDLQQASHACAHCTTPLTGPALFSSLVCPSASSNHSAMPCPTRFCNRLCLSRSARVHPLLCPANNPACIPLFAFARRTRWLACAAVAACIARVLLAHENGRTKDLADDLKYLDSLARMDMEARWRAIDRTGMEPDRETWRMSHKLTVQAFHEPLNPQDKKRLKRILRKPVPEDLVKTLFDFDAYLQALTRMSLNLEAHGGLYVLHSHLNHSCAPNISVRHLDTRTALSRITLRARRDIAPGEELTVSYVDPDLPRYARQQELMMWAFGACVCERCVHEEKENEEEEARSKSEMKEFAEEQNGERGEGEGSRGRSEGEGEGKRDLPDLEIELRHGLGLL